MSTKSIAFAALSYKNEKVYNDITGATQKTLEGEHACTSPHITLS